MLLKGPFEYELKKMIKEAVEADLGDDDPFSKAGEIKGNRPSSIHINDLNTDKKIEIKNAYKTVQSSPIFKKAQKDLGSALSTLTTVMTSADKIPPESLYWFAGTYENKLKEMIDVLKKLSVTVNSKYQSMMEPDGSPQQGPSPELKNNTPTSGPPAGMKKAQIPWPKKGKKLYDQIYDEIIRPDTSYEERVSMIKGIGASKKPELAAHMLDPNLSIEEKVKIMTEFGVVSDDPAQLVKDYIRDLNQKYGATTNE